MTAWLLWDGESVEPDMVAGKEEIPTELDALMGILFNAMGLAHALLKKQGSWSQAEARQQAAYEQSLAVYEQKSSTFAGALAQEAAALSAEVRREAERGRDALRVDGPVPQSPPPSPGE